MYDVVGVRFKKAGRYIILIPAISQFKRTNLSSSKLSRGVEYGKVVIARKQVEENDVVLPLKKVVRIADQKDRMIVEENKTGCTGSI